MKITEWLRLKEASGGRLTQNPHSGKATYSGLPRNTSRQFLNAAGNSLPTAAQDTICLLCHKDTLLACVQLGVHQNPQILLCKVAFQLGGLQLVLVHGAVPSQMQDFAFLCVELPC